MSFTPAVLVAVALRVGIPAFDVENTPAFVGPRLSSLLAAELNGGACAEARASNELTGPAMDDLRGCFGQPSCMASAAAALGLDKLVLGSVHRDESRFQLQILVLDVKKKRVERNVTDALPGRVDMLPIAAKRAAGPLCTAFLHESPTDELAIADVRIEPLAPAEFASLPLPELDLDIPEPAPEPAAAEPATVAPPPVASAPPAPLPTPPPAVVLVVPPPEPPPPPAPKPPAVKPKAPAPVAAVRPPVEPKKPSRPPPAWAVWVVGGGGAAVLVGAGLGLGSSAIRGRDVTTLDASGLPRHTLTRAEALRANSLATGANVSFGLGALVAAAGGVVLAFPDLLP